MSALEKLKIMKASNWLIEQLMDCGDVEFVDMVIAAVVGGEAFSEPEMQEITMEAYSEDDQYE